MNKNGQQAAHPEPIAYSPEHGLVAAGNFGYPTGMTKREEFAKAAMAGMSANPNCSGKDDIDYVAKWSVRLADAVLAELEKTEPEAKQETLPCGCVTCVCQGDKCSRCGAKEARECAASRTSGGPRHVEKAAA